MQYHTRMRGSVTSMLLLGAMAVACRSTAIDQAVRRDPSQGPPATIVDLPWSESPADRASLAARGLFERGQQRQALDMLEGVLAGQPRHADACRLRQDILRERGRRGVLWYEAERALEKDPNDGLYLYLFGRLVSDQDRKRQSFWRAAEVSPQLLWPWLGLAHTLRGPDPANSLANYERLYAAAGSHPLVGIAYAAMLREREQYDAAIPIYTSLQQDARVPGVGDLGLAQSWLAQNDRSKAWGALLAALRQRPFDAGVQGLLVGWLHAGASDEQVGQVFDALREDPERMRVFGAGDGALALAELLKRVNQPLAVRSLLEEEKVGPRSPVLRRLQRRVLLGLGEVDAFLELVRADVPEHVVLAEPNELRNRWLSLLRGPWSGPNALASADQGVELLERLRDVGWLDEVELAASWALRRWPEAAPRIQSLCDEARRELAFESGVRRLLYRGGENATASIETVLERMQELSVRLLGRDVVGKPTIYSVPMVGQMLDPFTGSLAEHLDCYNRHFVLGCRAGGAVEGMLVMRLSLSELPWSADLELPGRCFEVIGIDRDLRSVTSDLAGVALLNHFLIDFDSVREWARAVAERRRIAAEDGNALLTDPLPQGAGEDPVDVAWRLAVLSPVQDTDLESAVLDTIRHHERQHLKDSSHYLPIVSNLWRGLGLLLQFGLSPSAIEAEMERRAELASLAVSPHTELVLAHIADFLSEPGVRSPHHRGFGALGRELAAELQVLGLSPLASSPSRWHAVAPELVRQAARRLLDRLP